MSKVVDISKARDLRDDREGDESLEDYFARVKERNRQVEERRRKEREKANVRTLRDYGISRSKKED